MRSIFLLAALWFSLSSFAVAEDTWSDWWWRDTPVDQIPRGWESTINKRYGLDAESQQRQSRALMEAIEREKLELIRQALQQPKPQSQSDKIAELTRDNDYLREQNGYLKTEIEGLKDAIKRLQRDLKAVQSATVDKEVYSWIPKEGPRPKDMPPRKGEREFDGGPDFGNGSWAQKDEDGVWRRNGG